MEAGSQQALAAPKATTQDVVKDLGIGQPINSGQCSETADGVARESEGGTLTHAAAVGLRKFATYHFIASFNPSPMRCVGS